MKKNFDDILLDLNARANNITMDEEKILELVKEVKEKIESNEIFAEVSGDVKESIDMILDWKNGEYTNISRNTVLSVISGLIYLVDPFGIVPEFFKKYPLGDVIVLAYILKTTKDELEEYKIWKSNQMETEDTEDIEEESENTDIEPKYIEL